MVASKATLAVIRENVRLRIGLIVLAISLFLCLGFIIIITSYSSVHKTTPNQIPVLSFTSNSNSNSFNVTFSVTNPNPKLSLLISNLAVSAAPDRATVGGKIVSAEGLPVTIFGGKTKVLAPIILGVGNHTVTGFGGAIEFSLQKQKQSTIMHFYSPLRDIPTNLQLIPIPI